MKFTQEDIGTSKRITKFHSNIFSIRKVESILFAIVWRAAECWGRNLSLNSRQCFLWGDSVFPRTHCRPTWCICMLQICWLLTIYFVTCQFRNKCCSAFVADKTAESSAVANHYVTRTKRYGAKETPIWLSLVIRYSHHIHSLFHLVSISTVKSNQIKRTIL